MIVLRDFFFVCDHFRTGHVGPGQLVTFFIFIYKKKYIKQYLLSIRTGRIRKESSYFLNEPKKKKKLQRAPYHALSLPPSLLGTQAKGHVKGKVIRW